MSVELFDVFAGKSIGEGKKSLAYSLIFRSDERTLSDDDIERKHRWNYCRRGKCRRRA